MVNITMSLPDDLKEQMDRHKEINWSEIARQAIKKKLAVLEEMDKALADSELSEEDAVELGKKVNKELSKKSKKKGSNKK
ncbi:MAG: hypothetical protein ABEI74_01995 [Candidatus Pacearchaeota archaeon]